MNVVQLWQSQRNRLERAAALVWLRSRYAVFTRPRRMLGLALVLVALVCVAFPKRNAAIVGDTEWRSMDGCEYTVPDGQLPPYSEDALVLALDALPKEGKKLYAISELTLDFAFPVLYVTFFGAVLLLLARRRDGSEIQLSFALVFPLLAGVADLIENIAYGGVALGGAGHALAPLGIAATWAKITFLLLTLVAVAVTGRSRWGRWLEHLMIVRVPLLALGLLILLERLAGSGGLPTIRNMMTSKSALGLGIAVFATVLTMAVIGLAGSVGFRLAPERFKLQESALANWLEDAPVWSVILLLPLASAPLVCRLWQGAAGVPARWAGLLLGLGLAILPLGALEWSRRRGKLQGGADWLLPFFRALGPGFLETRNGVETVRRGHPLALGVTGVLLVVYSAGYFWLRPDGTPHTIPTIAYVLLLVAFLCQALTGISFFLDRYRFPLILGLVLYAVGFDLLVPQDHFFSVRRATTAAPSIEQALDARLRIAGKDAATDEPVLLTVIGASGGGIQAAAWTAQVLTGLEEALGPEFTRSIQLISSASGGSVGSLFFLEQLGESGALSFEDLSSGDLSSEDQPSEDQPSGDQPSEDQPSEDQPSGDQSSGTMASESKPPAPGDPFWNVREAAMASSLDATAWGLVFPDFLRAVFPPVVPDGQDRAWAMEQAWLQNLACMHAGEPQEACKRKPIAEKDQPWLSSWREKARRGQVPGIIFNGTFVEDGEPLLISNLDLSGFQLDQRPFSATRYSYDGRTDFALDEHYPGLPSFDLPLVTAARLSATFPYVTPVARAQWQEEGALPRWHVADGGFFDNYGTTAAVRWIEVARNALRKQGRKVRVLYIQVNAFPPSDVAPPCESKGWIYATLGPVKTIVNVRTSTQRVRNDLELAELKGRLEGLDVDFTAVTIRPPAQGQGVGQVEERIPEPLSWELSDANKTQVCTDWQSLHNQGVVRFLGQEYFGLEEEALLKPCPDRGGSKS